MHEPFHRTNWIFNFTPLNFYYFTLHWLSELGGFGAHSLDGSCESWGAKCVDKLLPGRRWGQFYWSKSEGEGKVPPALFNQIQVGFINLEK